MKGAETLAMWFMDAVSSGGNSAMFLNTTAA